MATFEEQMSALEDVVQKLERGELTLEESVRLFEQGIRLSRACKAELDAAEGRIEVLMAPETGSTRTRPLDVEAPEAES